MLDNIAKRIAWVIKIIPEDKDLDIDISDIALAKKLGTNKNTLAKYRNKPYGVPMGEVINNLVTHYKINPQWLFKGEGEPFPGACNKYEDVCGPEELQMVKEVNTNYRIPATYATSDMMFSSDQKINIDEAIGKTIRVLSAGTALSVALYMNIQQFAAALDTSQELKECKELIKAMQAQIDDLSAKVDRLTAPSTAGRQADGSEKEVI